MGQAGRKEEGRLISHDRNSHLFCAAKKRPLGPGLAETRAKGREEETITRLARVGYDCALGYLKGGFESWLNQGLQYDIMNSVSAETLEIKIAENVMVFDVRKPGEYLSEHILDAPSTPLDFLNQHLSEFPKDKNFYLHCAGGYRSMIAASILKARGYHNVINVLGGFSAIKETGIKITNYVCPSTLN